MDEKAPIRNSSNRSRDAGKSIRPRDVVKSKRPRDEVLESQTNYYRNQKQFNANSLVLSGGCPESSANCNESSHDGVEQDCLQGVHWQQRDKESVHPHPAGRWSGVKRTHGSCSEDEALLQRHKPS